MPRQRDHVRDFPGRRGLNLGLRSLHLAGIVLLGAALLVLVLLPGVGREVNGSQRWISLHFVTVQPSEFMKLAAVLYAADYTVRKLADMGSFRRGFVPMALVMALVGGLLLREPDFGAFVVIICIAMGILFLGGLNGRFDRFRDPAPLGGRRRAPVDDQCPDQGGLWPRVLA